MSQLKAPNGKPSNLTPEQWKLVRTPQFKAWFGDWENDPENASKVVDENGEPLVVYHGTYVENPFYVFDLNKADLGFHFGTYEQAKNRAETKLFFKNRKSIVNSFFLNIQNIFEMSDIGEWEYPPRYIDMFVSDGLISESDAKKNGFYRLFQREDNKQIREYLLAKYGKSVGFIYNNKYEGVGKSFIVLNPAQIKLADGTNTTFDGSNPDIRFAEGGKTKRTMKRIKRGGITYGKSHAEGGIPVKNQSTGDMLEVEGGEGIVNKRSMASKSKVTLNGKQMNICQAVSELNQMEGGVKFSCEDVNDRQFIKAMAKGGELDRGTRTEQEHIQVLKDLYAKRITPKQASERIAKDHLKEDSRYYSKLAKMEGKMADGGEAKLNTYQQRIKTNLEAMGTSEKEWSAVPINGFTNVDVNGKVKTMPEFLFPKNYQKPPTLFPNSTSGDMNCELCGRKPIATAYYIQNDSKKFILIVGSECVKHFGEGASGKENLRQFKIAEAEILNNDLIKALEYIKNTYSKIQSQRNFKGGITKSLKWTQSYVTQDYDKFYSENVSNLVKEGKLDALFTKGSFNKQYILWYQIADNFKPFDTSFYEQNKSDKDAQILSWFKRNKEKVEEMLKSLKIFESVTHNIVLDFDSIQNEEEVKNNMKMADGGKTRKNAKKTLSEAVGFDINSIDISKL
jgi:hypothetical protein